MIKLKILPKSLALKIFPKEIKIEFISGKSDLKNKKRILDLLSYKSRPIHGAHQDIKTAQQREQLHVIECLKQWVKQLWPVDCESCLRGTGT